MGNLQIKPGYTTPNKCTDGCARWDNLAADGNTFSQESANKLWAEGSPPADAGNQCAIEPNGQPFCFCKNGGEGKPIPVTDICQPPTTLNLQVVPGYVAPKCPEGCARWDNLTADGNTGNQEEINKLWAGGAPPPDAGNQCVVSPYAPDVKPWCLCKNGNTAGAMCEDRNTSANVCHSTPNYMDEIATAINNCTTTTEVNRSMNFAEKTFNINKDIETLQALVADSLVMGDTVFGRAGVAEITKQVQARHDELSAKKEHLRAEIDKKEAIVERSNRDFEDVKSHVPDPQPKRVLNVLEDYTMAFLVISYLFMILAGIYVFTSIAQVKVAAFFKALGGSIVLTIFMFMGVYYFT